MADKDFLKQVKKLRQATGAGVMDCRKILNKAEGDFAKAKELLAKRREVIAEKKSERDTKEGLVASYIHANGKIGALVVIECETDFVARTEDFQHLADELAMQAAAMDPADIEELMEQNYIREPKMTVADLVKKIIGKTGENIQIREVTRFAV